MVVVVVPAVVVVARIVVDVGAAVVGADSDESPQPRDRDADGREDGHERSPHAHPETLAQRPAQSGNSGTMNPGSWPS